MRRSPEHGFELVELLAAAAVAGVALLLAAPPLARAAARFELRLAAEEVVGSLRQARAYAIAHAAHVGLKFRTAADGTVYWALYRDADGDGVRTADLEAGVDPPVAPPRAFAHFGRRVRFGFPPGQAPTDPSDPRRRLDRLDDPVRFNRSDIASFSPLDGATPGSVYLTDGARHLVCVRIDSRAGRPRILVWSPEERRWR
jgi:type II secretory pathway pseudopilin PulG